MIDQATYKQHLAAFASGDWDTFKKLLANDVTYEEITTGQRTSGVDDYLNVLKRWKKAFPDSTAKIRSLFITEDALIAEVQWEGTHSAAYEGPMGTIPATNRRGSVAAIIVGTVKNNKFSEIRHYFDLLGLLRQMGVAPAMGAAAQPAAGAAAQPTRH